MKTTIKVFSVALLAGTVLLLSGCNKLRARDQLNKGVRAYKSAQFNEAIEHFKSAINFDPTLVNAKLYLATAYQTQFIPNAPSEDNMRMGQAAIDEYKDVLKSNPSNPNAIAGLGSLYYNMAKFDDAREWYKKEIQITPKDPIPYYYLGIIDWNESYKARMTKRHELSMADANAPFVGPKANKQVVSACRDLAQEFQPKVQDGLDNLSTAMQLRPDYADAMSYINLLYHEKADYECGDQAARVADLKLADEWVTKALDARRQEAAKAASKSNTGITLQ